MKNFLISILVVIFTVFQSFGQIDFGVKTGLNFSNTYGGLSDNRTRMGWNGGLLSEINLSKKFLIRPEVLYSKKGHRFPGTALNSGGTLSLNYISIPFLGGFSPIDDLTILLGPEFNFLTKAISHFDDTDHDRSKYFRTFDFAIDLGAMYHIKKGLGVELRYSYGFEGLADVTLTDQQGNVIGKDRLGSNRTFQIGIFYKFFKE